MIRQILCAEEISRDILVKTLCGKRMLAYLDAYGPGYRFCSFFQSGNSIILLLNSTMLICGCDFEDEELNIFIDMHKPFRIEGDLKAIKMIKNSAYNLLHRTVFQLVSGKGDKADEEFVNFSPALDDVYCILNEGFPNIAEYSLWLADASHRIRHGVSRVLTYRGSTTATLSFDIDNCVLVAQVATKISARGSGYARRFLTWLADHLDSQGKTAVLYALDVRASFYKEIGFKELSEEYVLELKENVDENILKGKLQYND